jgi:hypothetical protein
MTNDQYVAEANIRRSIRNGHVFYDFEIQAFKSTETDAFFLTLKESTKLKPEVRRLLHDLVRRAVPNCEKREVAVSRAWRLGALVYDARSSAYRHKTTGEVMLWSYEIDEIGFSYALDMHHERRKAELFEFDPQFIPLKAHFARLKAQERASTIGENVDRALGGVPARSVLAAGHTKHKKDNPKYTRMDQIADELEIDAQPKPAAVPTSVESDPRFCMLELD